jgi:hypothetical protein
MTARRSALVACLVAAIGLGPARAQSHGPNYGLATPTLGRGGWSLDVALMDRVVGRTATAMLRTMLSYGLTEDLQLSASVPVPLYLPAVPPAHSMARMPTSRDVEVLLGWRFQRRALGVGSRLESTMFVGLDVPTDEVRRGIRTAPGFYGALVGGYASRTVYVWGGSLLRRYLTAAGGDRPGDVVMYSGVLGWRPPAFRKDYPRPDWRIFLEVVGESAARDRLAGVPQPGTGGHQIFVGPTLLGLYGSWGISGGPLVPVFRRMNGTQPAERLRFIINTTWWF